MPDVSFFTNVINGYLPEPHASLLNGILFGVNLKTTKEFYQQIKMAGLLHLVVLSGINITILASIIANLTWFFSKKVSILLTILTIIIFIIFVGPRAPIVRAGVMGVLTFVGVLTGKKTYPLYLILLSVFFTAVFFPQWLKTLSFYLSYSATLGIILFGQPKLKKEKNLFQLMKNLLIKEFQPTFAAQFFTAPIIFIYFKQISFVSPLANFFVSSFIPPLMILGFITAILGKINYFLGLPFSLICYGILEYIIFVIKFFSQIPYGFVQF